MVTLPRLVIAAPASGHGKTTIATGLMAALSARGCAVSGHKVGPDYIDPGYHALATGRPGRNLDPHLVGEERLVPLLLHGARGADVAIVEGVMGLYDGQLGADGWASTAHVASVLDAPVVLVVDVSHASRSVAAVVQGMRSFDPRVRIAGVVLNKAGSVRHSDEVRRAIGELRPALPVLGVLHRDAGVEAPSRHLGLVPADEREESAAALARLSDQITTCIDLDAVVEIARSAPDLPGAPWDPVAELARVSHRPPVEPSSRRPAVTSCDVAPLATRTQDVAEDVLRSGGPGDRRAGRPVIAMAGGRAFTFRYAETEELLVAAGCDVVTFDPLTDDSLPPGTTGLHLGGGFPEVHAGDLAANAPLRQAIADAVVAGMPTVAECAGLLYLCQTLDDRPMTGVLAAHAAMTPRLTLGYRTVTAAYDNLLGRVGETVTGHEFHRTAVSPAAGAAPAWVLPGRGNDSEGSGEGFAEASVHASYVHVHWAGHPQLAARFAEAARHYAGRGDHARAGGHRAEAPAPRPPASPPASRQADPEERLRHHGDVEAVDGLVDLAVNVVDEAWPPWLERALLDGLTRSRRYPDATPARQAVAMQHGLDSEQVLVTAGAAEAFTLIARLRPWRHPLVVHPQFTEPDVALRNAGHRPSHVLCRADDGFAFDPREVPERADLVIIGNPTNPTGVLHPADHIRALLRPHRLVVVDEAFMDTVPGEPESLVSAGIPGLLVVRSLTKQWALPGIRAGHLTGDAATIAGLHALQTPWSVSAPAVTATIACCSPEARAETARRTERTGEHRALLEAGLDDLAIAHQPSRASFVLARTGVGVREALRAAGFAVRRGDTFPGLDESWVRIAVREPVTTRRLLAALRACDTSRATSQDAADTTAVVP